MSPGSTGIGTTGHSQRSRCAFWNRTRDMDRGRQSRLLDCSWLDDRGYLDLLHCSGSCIGKVEIWKSR